MIEVIITCDRCRKVHDKVTIIFRSQFIKAYVAFTGAVLLDIAKGYGGMITADKEIWCKTCVDECVKIMSDSYATQIKKVTI